MKKLVKYNELFGWTKKESPKKEELVEDPSLVEDIQQICMPLLDDGLIFDYDFKPYNSEYGNYFFRIEPGHDCSSDFGGIAVTKMKAEDENEGEPVDKFENWVNNGTSFFESKYKYQKSILENISEINDRLDDIANDWNVKLSIDPQNCYVSIKLWKGNLPLPRKKLLLPR